MLTSINQNNVLKKTNKQTKHAYTLTKSCCTVVEKCFKNFGLSFAQDFRRPCIKMYFSTSNLFLIEFVKQ